MLDHEELLPEEQAYPAFIQELRTTYQMEPEEKLVLTRVHQRLAQSSHALPLPQPAQAEGQARLLKLVSSTATPSRLAMPRRRWLQPLNALAAVLLLGLLVGSLVFTFAMIGRPSVGSPSVTTGVAGDTRIFLVPAAQGSTLSHTELETTRAILSQRLSGFGLKGSSVQVTTSKSQVGILVELPHFGGNEQQATNILMGTGALDFWGTGNSLVPVGSVFNPGQYSQYNRGSQPHFTSQDLDPNSLAVTKDAETGQPQIQCSMKGEAVQGFHAYTANNIGNALTVTLDGKVLQSAVIQSAISGPFVISGNFTQQQASAIVSVLKSGPLPVALTKQV